MSGVYAGLRVCELGESTGVNYAGQIMCDRGARVLKVESPEGDPTRHIRAHASGESKLFEWLGRGKESVVIDAVDVTGRRLLGALVRAVDVLLTNWTPARLEEAGSGIAALMHENPRLIIARASAWGDRGPWAGLPANDLTLQAASGLLASEAKARADGTPDEVRSCEITQFPVGMMLAAGIAGALLHRERTGAGQQVVCNELATAMLLQGGRVGVNAPDVATRAAALARVRKQRRDGVGHAVMAAGFAPPADPVASAGRTYYRSFVTRDGAVFMGALSRPLRDKIRKALGITFLLRDDPDFAPDDPDFQQRCIEFETEVVGRFRTRTTAEWLELLGAHGVPCGEVTFPEDLSGNEQARLNDYLVAVTHPREGNQVQVAPAARFGCDPVPVMRASPRLGEQTAALMAEPGTDGDPGAA